MLELAVQPPAQARPGVILYPPVVAILRSNSSDFSELSQTWAVAALVRRSGEVLEGQLHGRLADSAHPMPRRAHGSGVNGIGNAQEQAYFFFPDLVINEPGRYRIRVSLMRMDDSSASSPEGAVIVEDQVDSQTITVEDREAGRARPNSRERAILQVLRDDGQQIPS